MAAELSPKRRLVAPRNRKAFTALLVGGYKNKRHAMAPKLLDIYGINITDHWDMESRSARALGFPGNVELVLILSDLIPGGLRLRAIDEAKSRGIPFVYIHQEMASWVEPLQSLGLESPPLWLRPAPKVEEPAKPAPPPAPKPAPAVAAPPPEPAAVKPPSKVVPQTAVGRSAF